MPREDQLIAHGKLWSIAQPLTWLQITLIHNAQSLCDICLRRRRGKKGRREAGVE